MEDAENWKFVHLANGVSLGKAMSIADIAQHGPGDECGAPGLRFCSIDGRPKQSLV